MTDPLGLYTCEGSSTQCGEIATALTGVQDAAKSPNLSSNQQANLQQIVKFFGKLGDKGVDIQFSDKGGGLGNTGTEKGVTTVMINEKLGTYYAKKTGANASVELSGRLAHEGRHGLDEVASHPVRRAGAPHREHAQVPTQSARHCGRRALGFLHPARFRKTPPVGVCEMTR
jgi:hypothetical protein